MGQLFTTVVGGAIGFALGGPFGAQIGMMAGGMVGNTLFGPSIKGPRLNDLTVSASTYGNAIPVLYGTGRMAGNMIWSDGIKEHKHKKGGKGMGPKQTTYTYTCSFAMAFCAGEADEVLRIWADGKLIVSLAAVNKKIMEDFKAGALAHVQTTLAAIKGKKKGIKLRAYLGTEDQEPDPLIVSKRGADKTPAYRGLVYIVFEDMPLDDYGNRVPQITAEITKSFKPSFPQYPVTETGGAVTDALTYFPNWETERLYRTKGSEIIVYDIRTNAEITRRSFEEFNSDGNFIGGSPGYYVYMTGSSNSGKMHIIDLATLTEVSTIGNYGRSLANTPISECNGRYDQLNSYGETGGCRVFTLTGVQTYFISRGIFGGWSIYGIDGTWVGSGSGRRGVTYLTGREAVGSGEILGWAVNDYETYFCQYIIPSNAYGIIEETPTGNGFCPISSVAANSQFLQFNEVIFNGDTIELPAEYKGFAGRSICYDDSDYSIVVMGEAVKYSGRNDFVIFKYLLSTGEIKWKTIDTSGEMAAPYSKRSLKYNRLYGGELVWMRSPHRDALWAYRLDLATGEITKVDQIGAGIGGADTHTFQWDEGTQSGYIYRGSTVVRMFFGNESVGVSLKDIVRDICLKTNVLTESDVDVTQLNDIPVTGYIISRESTARDCLEQLGSAYFFDGVESDYKLKFVSRGGDPVGTISGDHLGYVADRDQTIRETRMQELELPMRVTVNYYAVERDYQTGSQFAKRITDPFPTMFSQSEQKTELPIAMEATDAKQIADKALKMVWTNRVTTNHVMPWEFIRFDPTDVVNVSLENGTEYRLRLTKLDLGVDYNIQAEAVTEDAISYVSTVKADGGFININPLGPASAADLFVINTPLLRDVDDTQGVSSVYYLAAGAYSYANFRGVLAMESRNDSDFEELSFLDDTALHGYADNALGDFRSWGMTDEVNTLRVHLASHDITLASCTQEQLLAGANPLLVGDEIIQYRDAVLNSDGSYTLSGFLRGRRGTSYALNNHRVGDRVIILNESLINRLTHGPDDWTAFRYLKAVPPGALVDDVPAVGHTFEPRDLMPYTPESVVVTDDGTDVTISWKRRSRITAPLVDGYSAIAYREGNAATGRFEAELYFGKDIDETPWDTVEPDKAGSVPLTLAGVEDTTPEFVFPLADLGAETSFLLRLREYGFVAGIPKIVRFERVGEGLWDLTESY